MANFRTIFPDLSEPEKRCQTALSGIIPSLNHSDSLEFFFNNSAEAVSLIGKDYVYRMVNDVYCRTQSKKREELVGRSVAEVWRQDVFDSIIKVYLDRCFSGQEVHDQASFELPGVGLKYFDVRYVPYKNPEGEVTHAAVFSRDVTERKGLEEQLRQSQKVEMIGNLTAGIAHDFNNLLAVIMGYAELQLRKQKDNPAAQRDLEQVVKAARRAANLTGQLLAFSRRQLVKTQVIQLNEVVIDMSKMLVRLLGQKIRLITVAAPDLDLIKADRGQLEQVIMNLAVNARDAMPAGGTLTVRTENIVLDSEFVSKHPSAACGEYLLVSVSDTGTGMSEEVMARIFDPFFTTKEKGKGTGLGLATCYGIVKQSGGFILVESRLGEGSTFRIYFPKTHESGEATSRQDETKTLPHGNETVLLVEDHPLLRKLSSRILREQGYTVWETGDAHEAIRISQMNEKKAIDLLLTNVLMSPMNGRVLSLKLRKVRPDLKVLFTSGCEDHEIESQEDAFAGSSAFLLKPFWPAALALKVRELLDRKI